MAKGARVSILAHRFYSDADAKEAFGTAWRATTIHGTVQTLHRQGGITCIWDGDAESYKSDYSHIEQVLKAKFSDVRRRAGVGISTFVVSLILCDNRVNISRRL